MASTKHTKSFSALIILIMALLIAASVYLCVHKLIVEQKAIDRTAAQEQWLNLIATDRDGAFNNTQNAQFLGRCFKKGESAVGCEKVLATARSKVKYPITGKGDESDGATQYSWVFTVEN